MKQLNTTDLYAAYVARMNKTADIRYASALMQWDQETYMPPKGAPYRGQQVATLSEMSHEFFTDAVTGDLLKQLLDRNDLSLSQKKNVELTWEDYSKQKKYDSRFVRTMAEVVNKCFHAWMEARKKNDFKLFAPLLSILINLKKEEAGILGYVEHPYDALLNEHDKGTTVKKIDRVFSGIIQPLKLLLQSINNKPQVNDTFLYQQYSKDSQWAFGMELLQQLGYDFEAGRQDISEHPFSISFNSNDVRITTRISENDLNSMAWSCIHELGHALYEQGLPSTEYGLPLGEAVSYSIHESQSRLWENHVGRSLLFCETFLPLFKKHFPEQFRNIDATQLFGAINKVAPSLIRTEADELTYHFHVIIRYELEKKLLENTLTTEEIPGYWNEQYAYLLGVTVPDDLKGCLQDVHWSHGSFGYFPTYSLGSFYAAQFYATATHGNPLIEKDIRNRNTATLLQWLRNHVYQHGRMFTSEELCVKITGESLNPDHLLKYLTDKYRVIYNF